MSADWYGSCARQHLTDPASLAYVDILARRARAGESKAMDELLTHLGGIAEVVSAKKTKIGACRGLERDDLRQEAMRAMLEALETWNPNKAAFRTHAYNYARWAVLDLINRAHVVSIPKAYAQAYKGKTFKDFDKLNRGTQGAAIQATGTVIPLVSATDEERDFDPGEIERDYEEILTLLVVEQVFHRTNLRPKEKRAIRARYGLGEEKTGELAAELGVSNQRVGNLARRGVQKMQIYNRTPATRRIAS